APRIAQDAALFGLNNLSNWVAEKREMINDRRDAVREIFRSNDLGYELISSGAYFAYARHPFPNHHASTVARRLADEHNILCLPGTFFGPDQEQCLRLAYANATVEEMPVLADRLRASL
ncbi:MAG: aminotransferase class I/II-fold pyridoxal phosphate-dependent enzyme, partial [Alphaproteobacteria bacterium]|nr:aminotransferase class I/II-fold pyridoxal phosphate-dependent enzyme [Alphaproteobacteria bacterium]